MTRSIASREPDIAAVILAAGGSTRFGACKQLLAWRGRPLVRHIADVALSAGLDPVIVVLGCDAERVYQALEERPVQTLINWRWEQGMSTSVQTGLAAVPPWAEGALFLQCDQPRITPDLLRAMVDRFQESGGAIVHPVHDDRRGTPVLFPRRFFAELSAVSGDQGGRVVIEQHADQVSPLEVHDADMLIDIDTPQDYEELQRRGEGHQGGDSAAVLRPIRHLIIDMDGVLWRGDEPMPGLQRFFAFLRERGIGFTLATNNASQPAERFAHKLASFGVTIATESVLTSSMVVASYLEETAPPGSPVYIIGEEGLRQALEEGGFVVCDNGYEDAPEADYVIVGWDRYLSWKKLSTAAYLIHRGATFIGTNPDITFPTEWGPAPGNGATLIALEASTGVEPIITGKPEPQMYEEALRRMGAVPETTAMIGDRLETDILGAARVGLTTVLTLSGISSADDLPSSPVQPDLVCRDIDDLVGRWQEVLAEG